MEERKRDRDGVGERKIPSSGILSKCVQWSPLGPKPEARNSVQVSYGDIRNSATRAFPKVHISGKLESGEQLGIGPIHS